MNLYPVNLNVQGRVGLIVGGGAVAERKAAGLTAAGASVLVVSPTLTPGLLARAEAGEVVWRAEVYGTGHLGGVFLVLACTDSREVNAQVVREASERGLLVLCADAPKTGSFVSPTVIRRGPLTLTVSTEGGSPTLSAVVREKLESEFGLEWGPLTLLSDTNARNCQNEPHRSRPQGRRAAGAERRRNAPAAVRRP